MGVNFKIILKNKKTQETAEVSRFNEPCFAKLNGKAFWETKVSKPHNWSPYKINYFIRGRGIYAPPETNFTKREISSYFRVLRTAYPSIFKTLPTATGFYRNGFEMDAEEFTGYQINFAFRAVRAVWEHTRVVGFCVYNKKYAGIDPWKNKALILLGHSYATTKDSTLIGLANKWSLPKGYLKYSYRDILVHSFLFSNGQCLSKRKLEKFSRFEKHITNQGKHESYKANSRYYGLDNGILSYYEGAPFDIIPQIKKLDKKEKVGEIIEYVAHYLEDKHKNA